MIHAKAFAPANISCIFGIEHHNDPSKCGSTGVGFCLDRGVVVVAIKDKENSVRLNLKNIEFPTVKTVAEILTNKCARIDIQSVLPLGCGYGLSGASALAAAYALNKLFNLKKSKLDLAIAAHTAEVINGTGLGDIVNQYYGGFCVKLESSANFAAKRLPIAGRKVYCRHLGPIYTKSIIQNEDIKDSINDAAHQAMKKIRLLAGNPKTSGDFQSIIRISKQFAAESGLLQDRDVASIIANIEKNGGNASMMMLGNAVFSDIPFAGSSEFTISHKGAYVY
ncbi:hypothetical protein HYX09_01580 [Candidatus Woesearchaeota archaeon]|nr:hypothetical protein [Candidatus Woesearchaeota archaeon]